VNDLTFQFSYHGYGYRDYKITEIQQLHPLGYNIMTLLMIYTLSGAVLFKVFESKNHLISF